MEWIPKIGQVAMISSQDQKDFKDERRAEQIQARIRNGDCMEGLKG